MSESMGDVNAQPKPGTALRIIMREHDYLNAFLAMVKAKMDLEQNHVRELRALRDSWNPNWNDSGIWPLISPFLTYINDEITQRQEAATELALRFSDLPNTPLPNSHHEDGFDPLITLWSLETRYREYEKAYNIIRTADSHMKLQNWREEVFLLPDHGVLTSETTKMERRVLPEHEREYRKAVVEQQKTAKQAIKWQRDDLPAILERHQQRAEDVKSFLHMHFNSYSNIHSSLSTTCSTALSSNVAFSPSRFIAPRHDEGEKEASHSLLQMMTAWLMNQLLGQNTVFTAQFLDPEDFMFSAFALEKEAAKAKLPTVLRECSLAKRTQLWMHAFTLDTPLLPLPRDVSMQYQNVAITGHALEGGTARSSSIDNQTGGRPYNKTFTGIKEFNMETGGCLPFSQ